MSTTAVGPGPGGSGAGSGAPSASPQLDGAQGDTGQSAPRQIKPIRAPRAASAAGFPGIRDANFDGPLADDIRAEQGGTEGGIDTGQEQEGGGQDQPQDQTRVAKPFELGGMKFRDQAHADASIRSLRGMFKGIGGTEGLTAIKALGGFDGIKAVLEENATLRQQLQGGQQGRGGQQQGQTQGQQQPPQRTPEGQPNFDLADPKSIYATFDWGLFNHLASDPKGGPQVALTYMMDHVGQYVRAANQQFAEKLAMLDQLQSRLDGLDQGPLADITQTHQDQQALHSFVQGLESLAMDKGPDGQLKYPELKSAPPEFWTEFTRRTQEFGPEQALTAHTFRSVYRDILVDMEDGTLTFGDWDPKQGRRTTRPNQTQTQGQPTRAGVQGRGAGMSRQPQLDVLEGGSGATPRPGQTRPDPRADMVKRMSRGPVVDSEFGLME